MAAPDATAASEFSDEVLVTSIVEGQIEHFDTLYERYFQRVYRFVGRRMSNRADVDETVQEVFINVFGSLGSFRAEAPFAAWVFGITRRTIAGRYKRRRAVTVPLPSDEHDSALEMSDVGHDAESNPLAAYERSERLGRLSDAARRLSADQWELFRLHHLEHRSIEDIAKTTHKSRDAVKSHLYRARKLLLAR